ncbi:SpoIIE family protein phosphatase [Streptomyces sp. NPDC056683]|uniref:SpoIIE family protein phosphatase n=1 Tax=Streptomyces sp. NPDC056683 TaxID=3345910 RepID=UPI003691589B
MLHLRDHADPAAAFRYERQYGVLAEGPLEGWQDQPQGAPNLRGGVRAVVGRSTAGSRAVRQWITVSAVVGRHSKISPAPGKLPALDVPVGPPLGFGNGDHYEQREIVLTSGSIIALFTDGLLETRALGLDAALARLADCGRRPPARTWTCSPTACWRSSVSQDARRRPWEQ